MRMMGLKAPPGSAFNAEDALALPRISVVDRGLCVSSVAAIWSVALVAESCICARVANLVISG